MEKRARGASLGFTDDRHKLRVEKLAVGVVTEGNRAIQEASDGYCPKALNHLVTMHETKGQMRGHLSSFEPTSEFLESTVEPAYAISIAADRRFLEACPVRAPAMSFEEAKAIAPGKVIRGPGLRGWTRRRTRRPAFRRPRRRARR